MRHLSIYLSMTQHNQLSSPRIVLCQKAVAVISVQNVTHF